MGRKKKNARERSEKDISALLRKLAAKEQLDVHINKLRELLSSQQAEEHRNLVAMVTPDSPEESQVRAAPSSEC